MIFVQMDESTERTFAAGKREQVMALLVASLLLEMVLALFVLIASVIHC